MTLLQHIGRIAETPCAPRALRGGSRPATRLARAHGILGHHGPSVARRRAAPCVARSLLVDAAAPSSAPPAALDASQQLTAAAVGPAPIDTVCSQSLPPAATTSAGAGAAGPIAIGEAAPAEASTAAAVAAEAPTVEAGEAAMAAARAATAAEAGPSTSGSRTSWPGRRGGSRRRGGGGGGSAAAAWAPPAPPPYASALTSIYNWPPQRPPRERPAFLESYPVPAGKIFNVNSFLGKRDAHGGQYLVTERRYRDFLASYAAALDDGYMLYLTENYHQRVYKYFLELDWDWDTDLALVMEVTPKLVALATQVASDFYSLPYANVITSIRSPYKVHLNFPQLLTTELLACLCRDRLLEACTAQLGPVYGTAVDWERLIDFPHGSLRLMGSRKAPHMDSDPAWVREKAYHPARLAADGTRWQPGRITPALLAAASIFPQPHQVAAFERSPAYLDMIYSDLEAYKKKMEERRQERARRRAEREQLPPEARKPTIPNLPPGSSKNPLYVQLEVEPDETVSLKIHIKARFRHKDMQSFHSSRAAAAAGAGPAEAGAEAGAPPADGDGASAAAAAAQAAPAQAGETVAAAAVSAVTEAASAADGAAAAPSGIPGS